MRTGLLRALGLSAHTEIAVTGAVPAAEASSLPASDYKSVLG